MRHVFGDRHHIDVGALEQGGTLLHHRLGLTREHQGVHRLVLRSEGIAGQFIIAHMAAYLDKPRLTGRQAVESVHTLDLEVERTARIEGEAVHNHLPHPEFVHVNAQEGP